jgi:hypothetical protein
MRKSMLQFIVLFFTACGISVNWMTYTDSVNKFTIKYPDKWQQRTAVNTIGFLSPREDDQDLFQENVNLMLQDLSQKPMTVDQYTELTKKQVIDNLGASAIISLKNITLSGQQAKEFVYNMDYQGRNLKVKQVWFIKGNTAYLFTYTAHKDKYEEYLDLGTQTINSFKFF